MSDAIPSADPVADPNQIASIASLHNLETRRNRLPTSQIFRSLQTNAKVGCLTRPPEFQGQKLRAIAGYQQQIDGTGVARVQGRASQEELQDVRKPVVVWVVFRVM